MEQQQINKCEFKNQQQLQIQQEQEKCSSIEDAKLNNVSKQKNAGKEILTIEENGNVNDIQHSRQNNYNNNDQDDNERNNNIDSQNRFISGKILDKKLKIKHNKKCSGCLKKHLNQDIFCCSQCPKSYHRSCLSLQNLKNNIPFFCQNCEEILKERQLRKSMKKETSSLKQTQLHKFVKTDQIIIKSQSVRDRTNTSIPIEIKQFAERFPLYIQNGKIAFPIEDSLLQEYSSIMTKMNISQKPSPTKILPQWFGTILQMWNTMQTFDEYMPEYSQLSMLGLCDLMESKQSLIAIQKLFIKLLDFISRDILNERFQNNKSFLGNPFLCLLKYCNDTGSLSRIFKYVWIQLLYQINSITEFSIIFQNQKLFTLIKAIRQKTGQHFSPELFEDKLLLLQSILNGVVQSTSYHDDLHLKIQKGRQSTRTKNESLEKIKQIEIELKQTFQRKRVITKEIRDTTKQMNSSSDKTKFQKQIEKLIIEQKSIESKQINLRNIIQIERQNTSMMSNGVNYTNVWFLGKDREHKNYWFVPQYRDRLFVNSESEWYQYNLLAVNQLTKCLNPKGLRQKQLQDNILQYKQNNYFGNIYISVSSDLSSVYNLQKQYETKRQHYLNTSKEVDFDKEEFISFQFIRKILILGQKKMFNYLDQKKARWGPPEERQAFITKIQSSSTNNELIQAAKFLNQKICVVEIQYTFIDDNGEQITDLSKLRKVQTKMWGINQKYKHAWLQYLNSCNENSLIQVFFLNAILYLTIDRYVSKMRDPKKPKKDFDDEVPSNQNKILNKRNAHDKKNPNKIQWQQTCNICQLFGELLCCDLCPKVFHLSCIGLQSIPQGNFQCQQCESKRHTRSITRKIVDIVQQ